MPLKDEVAMLAAEMLLDGVGSMLAAGMLLKDAVVVVAVGMPSEDRRLGSTKLRSIVSPRLGVAAADDDDDD